MRDDDALQLRMLALGDEAQFRAAVQAFKQSDPDWDFAFYFDESTDFADYVDRLHAWTRGERMPKPFVPNTFMVAVVGGEIVGRISIRHRLNDFLMRVGGHIGYGIVPAHRRKGYGREVLRQGLVLARGLRLERVLLTCDDDNEASWKIIELNGGQREDGPPSYDDGVPKRRYWIDLR